MLAGMPGVVELGTSCNGIGGASVDQVGGVLVEREDLLLFDGQLYDGPPCVDPEVTRQREVVRVLKEVRRRGPVAAADALDGDFAFAWVGADGDAWLARDRFGMRPLYYSRLRDGWAIASQPGQLLAHEGVDSSPDPAFLVRYGVMHYRMIDNDPSGSPYRDIRQVPAASVLRLRRDGKTEVFRYWSVSEQADHEGSYEDLASMYRELLHDAVNRRARRLQNRAFTLSGGMDSSTVLALAALEHGPQAAYSTVYSDPTYDERDDIADMLGSHVKLWNPVDIPADLDVLAEVEQLVSIHHEPVATATWLSHLHLTQRARADGVQAMFGGLGGDELNAGEYEYFPFHFADLRAAGRSDDLEHEQSLWARHHDHPIFRKSPEVAVQLMDKLVDSAIPGRCLPDIARMKRYVHALDPSLMGYADQQPVMESPFRSYLRNRTWQDLSSETLPCCIRAEDRHGAAYGIIQVLPFLDRAVVEFAYRVPGSMKIRDGVTKRLLREAMRGVLPEATRGRIKKTGWNAPAHVWFSGTGLDDVRDLVSSEAFSALGVYRRGEVLRLIDEHEAIVSSGSPRENHMMFLWQVVNLVQWDSWRRRQDSDTVK